MTRKAERFLRPDRRGLTLVEVLLAIAILGAGLTALLTGASRCIAVMRMARSYQTAQWVLAMGEAVHFSVATNSIEELDVDGDDRMVDGFTFSRHAEPDEDKDGLCILRTRVSWQDRGREVTEEVVGFVHDPKFEGRKP